MTIDEIHVGSVVNGPLLPEPVEVLAIVALGDSIKLIGKGCKTGLVRDPVLTPTQLSQLRCSPVHESFDESEKGHPISCTRETWVAPIDSYTHRRSRLSGPIFPGSQGRRLVASGGSRTH